MKISELFISLGFKVDGAGALEKTDQNLTKAEVSALKLLAGVAALNAAFYLMMSRAVDAAVGLDKFQKLSGVGTNRLQQMQYQAAKTNVATASIAEGLKMIEKTRAEWSLGNADSASPWFMLGITPSQDPVKAVDQLREAFSRLDPAMARVMASRAGFSEDFLYFLRQPKGAGHAVIVSPEEIDRLTKLGGAWKGLLLNISNVATKFASTFAEGLSKVVGWLERGAELLERFVHWLESGSPVAHATRQALMALVVVLGAAGIALGLIVALLGALKVILLAIQLIPVVIALTALLAVLTGMALAIVYVGLALEDLWVAAEGGKSRFKWLDTTLKTMRLIIDSIKDFKHMIATGDISGGKNSRIIQFTPFGWGKNFIDWNWRRGGGAGNGANTNTKVDIHVDGARDPVATGREVGRHVGREISDAFGTAPIATN